MTSPTVARILAYVRDAFLNGDPQGELDERTPLLEWGVLNSLNMAQLLAFIREDLGVLVPATAISPANFKNIAGIAELVDTLRQREMSR